MFSKGLHHDGKSANRSVFMDSIKKNYKDAKKIFDVAKEKGRAYNRDEYSPYF